MDEMFFRLDDGTDLGEDQKKNIYALDSPESIFIFFWYLPRLLFFFFSYCPSRLRGWMKCPFGWMTGRI
jgi:hypothetical protein